MGAYVISWDGFYKKSQHIVSELEHHADALHVIYSNKDGSGETGQGNWHKVPNECFFGGKFKTALDLFNEDIFLLVHADVTCDSWPSLVEQCRKIFSFKDVGVWVPDINFNPWSINKTKISEVNNLKGVHFVAATDAIVVAYSAEVISRLKQYNYEKNHFGWGIDWAAVCYAYCNNLMVLGDTTVKLHHPQSPGYSTDQARQQMNEFFQQMTVQERMQYAVLNGYISQRIAKLRSNK